MIRFDQMSFQYDGDTAPTLAGVDLEIGEGELCLVIGTTGSGKSTLLGTVNGLVPHFSGGTLSGSVQVDGRDTRTHPPRELADVVGVVGQNPRASFVTEVVEDELAYTMESLALPPDLMRRRMEDILDLLSLTELRDRPLSTLSGGQAQRVAIGAVLTAHPRVLVLDEPTSALDPAAAEEVLAAVQRLVHDNALTVLMAEHRLERVLQYADSVLWVPGNGERPRYGAPAELMANAPVYPAVVGLGKLFGWDPIPLSVRAARQSAAELRRQLPEQPPTDMKSAAPETAPETAPAGTVSGVGGVGGAGKAAEVVAQVDKLGVRYGSVVGLNSVSLELRSGEIVAVMGRNGAGKSTLFAALTGLIKPSAGQVRVVGNDPRRLSGRELTSRVALVPQQPADLLYGDTVGAECETADREAAVTAGTCAALLAEIAPEVPADRHPRDLSEGQQLSLTLAIVLTAAPSLLLLDEPTRGLDYPAKARLVSTLTRLASQGHSIALATHDVELAADLADRTVVLADGEVVVDGPSREVVTHSPIFAPQVAKVLSPLPYLTVEDVRRAVAVLQ